MFTFDPSQYRGDVPVFAIEGNAALLVMPSKAREAALNSRH